MFASYVRGRAARAIPLTLLVAVLGLPARPSRAEQFTIVDESWTHDASAKDSHHYVNPSAATPKNLASPVDYAHGSVHVVLDVKTKPAGNTPTKFQVCFEGSPSYDCTAQSPTYTTTGQVVWSTDVQSASFYKDTSGGGLDFTKPIKRVALILKDTMNGKPSPDNVGASVAAMYTPTDLHIEVVWVSAGSTYAAPARDAGLPDASVPPLRDASVAAQTPDAASAAPADASTPTSSPLPDAGLATPPGHDAGRTRSDGDASPGRDDGGDTAPATKRDDGGCHVHGGSHTDASWFSALLAGLALLGARRRRRTL